MIKSQGVIQVQQITASSAALTAAGFSRLQEICAKLHVQIVAMNVKFLSNQKREGQSIAENALPNIVQRGFRINENL